MKRERTGPEKIEVMQDREGESVSEREGGREEVEREREREREREKERERESVRERERGGRECV